MKDIWSQFRTITNRFRDLTFLSISNIVTNGIGGVFWLYMASLLGTKGYGEISYIISIAVISSTISLAGMSNVLIVYGAKNVKIQSTVFLIGLISSIITSLIVFFFVVNDITISLYVIGFVIFTLIMADLIGRKLFLKYSKIIIIQKIMLVVFSIIFYHLIGLQGVVLGIALSFLVFSFIIYKTLKEMKVDFSIFKDRYRFAINSFLLDITTAFNGSLDKIILAPLLGFSLLGNYQLGLQFIGLLHIIPGMLFQYILSQDSSGTSTKFIKKIIIYISIILAVLSITLSPIFVSVLFPKFTDAVVAIQIMSVSIIPSAITSTYISKYLGLTKSKIIIVGSGSYLAIQVVSLIILGNMYGLNGAATSLVISSIAHVIYFVIIDRFHDKFQSTT
jgi:O-antigen/teichoic acid export membrane protein